MFDFVKPIFSGYLCTYPDYKCRISSEGLEDLDYTPCADCEFLISEEDYYEASFK